MNEVCDTYTANIIEQGDIFARKWIGKTLAAAPASVQEQLPSADEFCTLENIRSMIDHFSAEVRGIVLTAASVWKVPDGKGGFGYSTPHGFVDPENEPEHFFQITNKPLLEIGEEKQEREKLFAFIAGNRPDLLVPYIKEGVDNGTFDGVKIGAMMGVPLDDDTLLPLWEYCQGEKLPVMIHCNQGGDDFEKAVEIARTCPNMRVAISHLGGECKQDENIQKQNKAALTDRVEFLKKSGCPDNVYFNTAVQDIALVEFFLCQCWRNKVKVTDKIIWGSDMPFLGAWNDIWKQREDTFPLETREKFTQNGQRYLGIEEVGT